VSEFVKIFSMTNSSSEGMQNRWKPWAGYIGNVTRNVEWCAVTMV